LYFNTKSNTSPFSLSAPSIIFIGHARQFAALEEDMLRPNPFALVLLSVASTALFCGNLRAQDSSVPADSSASPSASAKATDAALPALKEILEKNEEVMGGRAAWSRLTSQQMTGVYQTEDGSRFFTIEILAKSPNKSLYKLTSPSPNELVFRDVCDGHSAWVEDPQGGYHELSGPALASRLHRSEFLDRGKVLLLAATGKVTGTAKVGPYLTYVVEFVPQKDLTSRIYFDSDSGYAIRTEDTYITADGPYTVRVDFADYRAIDGMKFAFRMRRSERGAVFYIRLTQLKNNVFIDDSAFLKPESASSMQP
jgi:outer membrane lipoprotein-sorting protein